MDDLQEFSRQVEKRLADADRDPHWRSAEAERYMAEVEERRRRFDQVCSRMITTVIRPRLEVLISFFPNASLAKKLLDNHASCLFGYCRRFPTTAKVEFVVEHDLRCEMAVVRYEAYMMPVFVKFDEHDKVNFLLDQACDGTLDMWVEERLLEFLDAYLRIDSGAEDYVQETVVDPVCGMRINRSLTVANQAYCGHSYFFCSIECHEKFSRKPSAYVQVKTPP